MRQSATVRQVLVQHTEAQAQFLLSKVQVYAKAVSSQHIGKNIGSRRRLTWHAGAATRTPELWEIQLPTPDSHAEASPAAIAPGKCHAILVGVAAPL